MERRQEGHLGDPCPDTALPLHIVRTPEETGNLAAEGPRDFETFFEDEYPNLFGALCLVTRNRHEAEEIAQDAFLELWGRGDRVGAMDDPAGYLYRTAMNAFRKRCRRAALALKKTLRIIPSDDGIEAVDARDAVVRALAPLSDRQRVAVVLMDLLGYPSEEAARMLGVSASTIRNHASRAHAALKKTMSRHELLPRRTGPCYALGLSPAGPRSGVSGESRLR